MLFYYLYNFFVGKVDPRNVEVVIFVERIDWKRVSILMYV